MNATPSNQPEPDRQALRRELWRFASLACDDSCDEESRRQLAELLERRPELIDDYAAFVATEAMIETTCGKTALDLPGLRATQRVVAPNSSSGQLAPSGRPAPRARTSHVDRSKYDLLSAPSWPERLLTLRVAAKPYLPYAISAALLLAVGGWLLSRPGAHLVATEDAVWSDGEQREVGQAIGRSWLTLEEGEARLAFRSGAMASIRGPARFRARSANRADLKYGLLSAHVPDAATGFLVATPRTNFIDLGTGFRVQTQPTGESTLHVTEGEVRVERQDRNESATLRAGQVATIGASDEPLQIAAGTGLEVSRSVQFMPKHAASLGYKAFSRNDLAVVFLENYHVTLPKDFRLIRAKPGRLDNFEQTPGRLSESRVVSCYLVHCSPARRRHIVTGRIAFPGEIVGFVATSDSLNATNGLLGATWTLQCQHSERGLESAPNLNADAITLSNDLRSLSFVLRTESIDQIRVLVAE